MTWNYRLVIQGDHVSVREVYYRANGSIESYTANPVNLDGYVDKEDMTDALAMILADIRRHPPLTEADLPGDVITPVPTQNTKHPGLV